MIGKFKGFMKKNFSRILDMPMDFGIPKFGLKHKASKMKTIADVTFS